MLRIHYFPHPILRHKCHEVQTINDRLRYTIQEMFELMYKVGGIGLAANQVGIPLSFFITNIHGPDSPDTEKIYINPKIIKRHLSDEDTEGCLSLPRVRVNVHRAKNIRVQYYDMKGVQRIDFATKLESRAIQHETDHTTGTLIIDRASKLQFPNFREHLNTLSFDYRELQRQGVLPSDQDIRHQLSNYGGSIQE